MHRKNEIEIRVLGHVGSDALSLENLGIREIKSLYDLVEPLLYSNQKVGLTPIMTYSQESGSVNIVFKTTPQNATVFLAVLSQVSQTGSLDGLEINTARVFQEIQKSALKNGYTYEFGSPQDKNPHLVVSKQTNFFIYEDLWANAEFYFYGILVNAGVKDKTSIHLQTKDYGMITFSTEKDFLPELDDNALYTQFVARASGRQNITTGEIDMSSLQLLELTPYDPKYDEQYIGQLMKQATESWKDVDDVDQWISEIRGTNE